MFSPRCRILHLGKSSAQNRVLSSLRIKKTAGPKLDRSVCFPLVRPCFDPKQTASQNRQNSVTGAFHLAAIVSLSSETKPNQNTDFRFPVCQIAQTGKMPFSLCSLFVRWAVSPDLGALFQNVANANPANSANRMVRFQIRPCCNLVVIGVCYCYSCYFGYSKGARFKRNPAITLLCFPNLALTSP